MDSPRKAEDNLNTAMIVAIGGVGSLLVWASIVALQAYYDVTAGAEAHRREIAGQSAQLRSLEVAAQDHLSKYGKSATGKVAIPIERAMELIVRNGNIDSLVPAVGPHNQPTIPAAFGRPSDKPTPVPAGAPAPAGKPTPPGTPPAPEAPAPLEKPTSPGAPPAPKAPAPAGKPTPPGTPPAPAGTPASTGKPTPSTAPAPVPPDDKPKDSAADNSGGQ